MNSCQFNTYHWGMLNERLKNLRLAKGMTLQQVADVFGISRASVGSWESGTNQPDPRKLEKLSELFDTSIEYLITGHSRGPHENQDVSANQVSFISWNDLVDGHTNKITARVGALHTNPSKDAFATRLLGSASLDWSPGPIPVGSILIVEPKLKISHGCFVLAFDNSSELGLAEAKSASDQNDFVFHFRSKQSSIQIKDKTRIFGVVTEWRLSGKL